ncbi:MAG: single-stranded DNA-binding protein, partial [Planctomycetes bacterium]|nr:single-stranded DNA-binding protein [Planctomycetota bacterium]
MEEEPMASYNRIVLMGNLTRDPQLSYTPSNVAI